MNRAQRRRQERKRLAGCSHPFEVVVSMRVVDGAIYLLMGCLDCGNQRVVQDAL